jgi:hypothetical protein
MAQSQHAKSPKLNALLIGKRTVPSGCRVLNVSQQGMSLQCDPDGRLLTFSSGDSVDIYLSVEHANGQNKFTIPAIVSHVDANTIDVVFHCTDTELAGLIESYRNSEAHSLEASINHRRVDRKESAVKPVAANKSHGLHEQRERTATQGSRSFYARILILFAGSLVLLGAYYYVSSINKRLNALETVTRSHTDELAEVQTQVFSSRLQEGRYASLNARMKALTDAFQSFEKRVTQALPQEPLVIASAPVPVREAVVTPRQSQAGTSRETEIPGVDTTEPKPAHRQEVAALPPVPAEKATVEKAPTGKAPAVIADKPAMDEPGTPPVQKYPLTVSTPVEATAPVRPQTASSTGTAAEITGKAVRTEPKYMPANNQEQPPVASPERPAVAPPVAAVSTSPALPTPSRATETTIVHSGPWVMNLLSSTDKAYVDKARTEARSMGIDVVATSAMVKGKQYWRLQIPGFESMAAAKKAAEPVKEQMKIKEVWIFKRR